MAVLSVVSPRLARVLRLTAQQRFGRKRKTLAMELQVRGKRKRLVRELQVGGKRKRELPVGGIRKRLKTELLLIGLTRKRHKMERLVGPKRKRELPVGGTVKKLKRELQPIGGKRKSLARELQPIVRKTKRLTREKPVGGNIKRLMRELPEELIIDEIIMRLPIKSVGRFKCVSKSWLSIISGSRFIKEHNIRSPVQNPNDYDCFVIDKFYHITIVSRNKETFLLPVDFHALIGSVIGLVCILRDFGRVTLWNPAIYQFVEFNLPQDEHPTLIGVAFDHASNDCKVVVYYPMLDSCDVYSSNSNSWIQLSSIPDHKFLMNKLKVGSTSFIPTTYVKDCPYWTYSAQENTSLAALKFDATSNKFKLLREFFPDTRSRERGNIFTFVNMRDLLTLLEYGPYSLGKLDVYSLDEENGVWNMMHRVGPFEEFWRFENLQQGFKYGDEIVFFEIDKICYYDQNTKTFKYLPGTKVDPLLNCFTFTPSMVSLQGMKSIYPDTQISPLAHPLGRLIASLRE